MILVLFILLASYVTVLGQGTATARSATVQLLTVVGMSTGGGSSLPLDTFPAGSGTVTLEMIVIPGSTNHPNTNYQYIHPYTTNTKVGAGNVSYSFAMSKYLLSVGDFMQMQLNPTFSWWPNPPNTWTWGTTNWTWATNTPLLTYNPVHRMEIVNWLNTVSGYHKAYRFSSTGEWMLWDTSDAWVADGQTNWYRHKDCMYFIPSMDEWQKAMFWDAANWKYWHYAHGSNTAPYYTSTPGTTYGTIVANYQATNGPASVFESGGLSINGFANYGVAWESIETSCTGTNNNASSTNWLVVAGGKWTHTAYAWTGNDYELPYDTGSTWPGARTVVLIPSAYGVNPNGYCAPNNGIRIARRIP